MMVKHSSLLTLWLGALRKIFSAAVILDILVSAGAAYAKDEPCAEKDQWCWIKVIGGTAKDLVDYYSGAKTVLELVGAISPGADKDDINKLEYAMNLGFADAAWRTAEGIIGDAQTDASTAISSVNRNYGHATPEDDRDFRSGREGTYNFWSCAFWARARRLLSSL